VYIDKLLKILRKSGFGCTIFGVFFGAVVYADDIFLLSASRSDLQIMINECQKFGAKMNLKFGTNPNPEKSKTKCLIFSKGRRKNDNIKKVELDGNELPWVQSVKHLGHTLQSNNSMTMDINMKRGSFISKVNSLIQEFHYASPDVMLRLVQAYACNMYGSNTWDLFSPECQKIYTSYNVAIRNILKLPRKTHRYLL